MYKRGEKDYQRGTSFKMSFKLRVMLGLTWWVTVTQPLEDFEQEMWHNPLIMSYIKYIGKNVLCDLEMGCLKAKRV